MSAVLDDIKTPASTAKLVKLQKFEQLTGYSPDAVHSKIKRGDWLEGHEFVRAPDGNVLVNLEGYYRWAAGQRRVA